ncbi:MAG: hypothetical protein PWP23_1365 [Candidatus Sumerlaeota bacterium]|nr:hypothetical protein [Candidatus Sumerlaeota bacterium]
MARKALILLGAVMVLAACYSPRNKSRIAFVEHFGGTYRTSDVEIFETFAREMPSGERRFVMVGAVPNKELGGWNMVWAEVGRVGGSTYLPLEYPAAPVERARSWDDARKAAARLRASLEEQWADSAP